MSRATVCRPEAHDFRYTTQILTGLPLPAGTPALWVKACTRCALAEALHVLEVGGLVGKRSSDVWTTWQAGQGYVMTDTEYARAAERGSWL